MMGGEECRKDLVEKSKKFVDLAIRDIRCLSKQQVTPPKKIDLKGLIEELLKNLNEHGQADTKFDCNVEPHLPIDDDLKLNIYRIVQEQTNNILKHAAATQATIVINKGSAAIHVSVIDNGKGFDPALKRKGIGISNIINRIDCYNGDVYIESSPGKGCKLEIVIPLD